MTDDPLSLGIAFFFIVLLVVLNGFFVMAEGSLLRYRTSAMEVFVQQKKEDGPQRILENLSSVLPVTQLGRILVTLALGWFGEKTVATVLHHSLLPEPISAGMSGFLWSVAFFLLVLLYLLLGYMLPKMLAYQKVNEMSRFFTNTLLLFYWLLSPFLRLLNLFSRGLSRAFGIKGRLAEGYAHNEDELRLVVSQSHENGIIDETERTLFDNIFDFTNRVAREIMVPRTDMVCLYTNRPFQQNLDQAEKEKHTRFPLCVEDKDHIVGILHIKDLYSVALAGKNDVDLRTLARKPVTVPEAMPIKDVLHILQKNRSEMAIVLDEYGGTAGIVTTEDILEELVGEIQDEFDEERPFVEKIADDTVSIDARMLIDEVNEYFHLDIQAEEVDTIGGWVFSQFPNPPRVGSYIVLDSYLFSIAEMESFRITRLHVKKIHEAELDTETA